MEGSYEKMTVMQAVGMQWRGGNQVQEKSGKRKCIIKWTIQECGQGLEWARESKTTAA